MSNYCGPLLAALKDCVLHSDCVIKDGKLPSECIKHHLEELPEECRSLRLATFECKRGMVYTFFLLKSCINTLLMYF
jgi:cytochrome c oxidase assembly factor 5